MITMNIQKMGIVLLLGLVFLFLQTTYAATPVGRVVWVQGAFKAALPGQSQRTLQKASLIYVNDTLSTDSSSQAQIVFTDNTLMTFRSDTKFHIDQYQYNPKPKSGSVGKYVVSLIEGGFRTITGLISKNNPKSYRVNTPVATIGVRGTDYTVYVSPKGQLYVGYYSGSPCVGGGSSATLCLGPQAKYAYVPSPGATPIPLQQPPAVLKEKLPIVPAKIALSSSQTDGTSRGGSDNSSSVIGPPEGGSVSGFCITN